MRSTFAERVPGPGLDLVAHLAFWPTALAPAPVPECTDRATVIDFNSDGHPDYVLQNPNTRQTAIWYLSNNVYVGSAYGPTLTGGWSLRGVADFNRDSHPDYALFSPGTEQNWIWYLSGPTLIGSAYGPTLPNGWELVATTDFNGDNKPDYVLYNSGTDQTEIWYLNRDKERHYLSAIGPESRSVPHTGMGAAARWPIPHWRRHNAAGALIGSNDNRQSAIARHSDSVYRTTASKSAPFRTAAMVRLLQASLRAWWERPISTG